MKIFFNKSYTQKRLTDASDKESYTELGSIEGGIFSMTPDDIMLTDGDPATGGVFYADEDADIKVGDKIVDGSDEWIVKSIKTPNNVMGYGYKRCVINLNNS